MLVKDGKVKIVYSLAEALETLAAAKNLKDDFQPILRILESLVSFGFFLFCFREDITKGKHFATTYMKLIQSFKTTTFVDAGQ